MKRFEKFNDRAKDGFPDGLEKLCKLHDKVVDGYHEQKDTLQLDKLINQLSTCILEVNEELNYLTLQNNLLVDMCMASSKTIRSISVYGLKCVSDKSISRLEILEEMADVVKENADKTTDIYKKLKTLKNK